MNAASGIVPGMEEVAALLLDATEKVIYSPGLSLNSYACLRVEEIRDLRGFRRASLEAADPSKIDQYLAAPTSQMLSTAQAELNDWGTLIHFQNDVPGIYQRLSNEQKSQLIERIQTDGQASAFLLAYKTRPDIFHSLNFVPQGVPLSQWKSIIGK